MWTRALLFTAALAALAALTAADDIAEDARLDVPALVRKYGYPLEEHEVVTEDGYVLTAHRIPHARGASPAAPRVPVLVMHGLLCSSADFLVLGPGRALGYVLADAGYDVWLGNARGNHYSRRHRALDPDERAEQRFWRFSWDEIGERDLPALLERVRAVTGHRRVHYVGYSQGTTALLVLLALRPQYNARLLSFHALAPAAFVDYHDDPGKDFLVRLESVLDTLAFRHGFGEVMPRSAAMTELGLRLCSDGAPSQPLCARLVLGEGEYFNKTLLPVFLGHNPAGAGVRQILHYAQVQRFGRFARYNFDPLTNLARYGSLQPPEYDVRRVRVPTHLHYAMSDRNSLYQNVLVLARHLGTFAALHRVPRHSFNHYDFIWGGDARAQVYDAVVAALRAHDAA
ncbi:lipase 1-like [Maniola jurtina]|uniref:lipase 1-like n=1 Tax=Maniola jurtina TaxID=191418 RepID=UPI001E68ED12|nr:lipase 1-like [Maniola jurtina]